MTFRYIYLGRAVKWQTTGSNFLMNMLPDVCICPLRKSALLRPEENSKTNTSGSIANSQRMPTEINKTGVTVSEDFNGTSDSVRYF